MPATSCSARASAVRSSLIMPRSLTSQPSRASIAISMKRLESNNCAAARASPGDASSLPVENTATRMRLTTSSCVRPNAAASATSCGRSRCPAFSAAEPDGMSSPAGRTLAPGLRPAGSTTLSPSTRTSSCMNTVSAPSGIGAPVKMRIACPGLTGAFEAPPAWTRPAIGNACSSFCGRSRLATA